MGSKDKDEIKEVIEILDDLEQIDREYQELVEFTVN